MKTLNPVEAGAIPLDDAPDSAEWFDPGKLGLIPVEGPIAATTDYLKLYARGATSQGIYMGAAGAARGISKTIEPELNPYMAMTPDAISERQTDLQARIKEYSEMQESARAEFARMGVKSERTIDPRMQEMERELSLLEEASTGQRTAINQAREAISKPFELYAQEAQAIRDAIVKGLPVDPEREASFAGGLAQGFGQITTMLPAYFIPGFGPMLAVGQVYQAGYDDYVQTMEAQGREFDPDEAHRVGMRNMPAGALNVLSDKLVISKILKPLKGKMTVGELQKTLAVTAAVGAATEGSQEFWQNFVAKHLAGYDPGRKLDDGVIDAMIIGAIVDATVATGGQALTSKLAQSEPVTDWTPEQSGAIPLDEVTPTPAEPATPAEQQPASEQRTQESQPPVVRETESLQEVTPDAEVETRQNREVEAALEAGEQGAAEGVDAESGRSDEAVAPEAVEQTQVTPTEEGAATVTQPESTQVDESTPARVEEAYGTEPERTGETRSEAEGERGAAPLRSVEVDSTPIRTTETERAGQWFESYHKQLVARAEQLGAPDPESAATDAVLKVATQDVQGDPLPLLYTNLKQQSASQWRKETAAGRDVRQTSSLDAPLSTEGDMTLADTQESGEATPAQAAEASDRAQMVQAAIQKLPERQRLLVQRIFFEGKKPAEVARELGLSKTTIGKDYQAASTALKEALISLSNDATPQTADRRLGLVPDNFVKTQNFIRWLKEWATTWKNVPRELVPALEGSKAAQRSYYERGRLIIRDLKAEARRAYGKDSVKGEAAIREALLNPDAMDALPDKVKAETMRLRNLMDELSIRAVNEVIVDPDLATTILDNTGSYMRRSYRVFSDPDWFRKVDPETLRTGKAWIKENWDKNRTLTDTEVDIVVAELLDSDKAGGFLLGGAKIGGKDVTSLIQRKNIAPEVRALMGEITNPFESAVETIKRQANMIEQHNAQQVMRRIGLETGIFTSQKTPTHFKPVAPVKNPGSHDVLAGLYTTPDVMNALTDYYKSSGSPSFGNIFFDGLRSWAGTAKATKTVLAPVTWPVNYVGAIMTMTAQGNLNPASYGRGVVHVLEQTGLLQRMSGNRPIFDRQKLQDRIALLTKHNLLNQNLTAGDMILSVEKSLLGRIPGVKDVTKAAAGIFQAGDNIVKFASWEQEMNRYKEAYPNMPEAELETRVAEVVAQTTQMYDRTPITLKEASIVLPFQSFINFQYDMLRVSVNTARLAKAEINEGNSTGNKALVRIGQKRALAFTGMMLAASNLGVALLSRMFNGVDDDEEEAMRYFMPPWFQDSNIFWASGIENGQATYANVGYIVPHANVLQAFESGWREGDGFTGVVNKTLEGFGRQFIQEPVHLNPLLDALRNTNQRGREIVNREDPNKGLKLASYVMEKSLKPGFMDQLERVSLAVNEETGPYGQEYSVKEEMLRMMAVRAQTVDVRKNLPFKVRELKDRWQNATDLYRLSKNRNLPEAEMDKRYADAEKARQDVFQEFVKMREMAGRLGVEDLEVRQIMRQTPGLSHTLIRDVSSNTYRPLDR